MRFGMCPVNLEYIRSNPRGCFPPGWTGFLLTREKIPSLLATARLWNTKVDWSLHTPCAPGLPASARSGASACFPVLLNNVLRTWIEHFCYLLFKTVYLSLNLQPCACVFLMITITLSFPKNPFPLTGIKDGKNMCIKVNIIQYYYTSISRKSSTFWCFDVASG